MTLPTLANVLTCSMNDNCLGATCCLDLDLSITHLSVNAAAYFDGCTFEFHIQIGVWEVKYPLFEYNWGK